MDGMDGWMYDLFSGFVLVSVDSWMVGVSGWMVGGENGGKIPVCSSEYAQECSARPCFSFSRSVPGALRGVDADNFRIATRNPSRPEPTQACAPYSLTPGIYFAVRMVERLKREVGHEESPFGICFRRTASSSSPL